MLNEKTKAFEIFKNEFVFIRHRFVALRKRESSMFRV